jgi:hypothetical protein
MVRTPWERELGERDSLREERKESCCIILQYLIQRERRYGKIGLRREREREERGEE